MSEHSKSDVLKRYPSDTKCALCRRVAGYHNATTGGCPFGKCDRTGGYSHSTKQFFSPMLPRLKNQTLYAVTLLVNTLNENRQQAGRLNVDASKRDADALVLIQNLDYAYWNLFNSILEQNDATRKRTPRLVV